MACTFKGGVRLAGLAFGFGKLAQVLFSRNFQAAWYFGRGRCAPEKRNVKMFWAAVTVLLLLVCISAPANAACIDCRGEPVSQRNVSSWTWIADGYNGASLYLDKGWYYILDKGQYDYLERGQYKLMNGFSFVLEHPAYPKLFEKVAGGGIGFESWGHVGFFGIYEGVAMWGPGDEQAENNVGSEGYGTAFASYGAGDFIDRRRYLIMDREQYYFLDRTQYLLTGGLAYLYGRFSVDPLYDWSMHLQGTPGRDGCNSGSTTKIPEPSTMAVLTLGCLCLGRFGRRDRVGQR